MTIFKTGNHLYDQVGRKLKTWEQLTNLNNTPTTKTLVSKIDYDEIGQVLNKHLQSTDSVTFLQIIAYTYNERGWLLSSSAPLFAMTLYYNQSAGNKTYNGNIMYQYWGTSSGMTHLYNYNYDKLNRLLYGVMELTPSGTILNAEQGISYDQMGNITQLVRTSSGTTQIDNLAYTYTGNQLQSILDNTGNNSGLVAGTTNYTWDGNGNMLTDTNSVNMGQNKTVTYNLLNLPQLVKVHTGTVTYTYDALGNKLRKVSDLSGVTHTTDYIAGIEYDGTTTDTLNFIQTEEGKAAKFGSIYDYTYYLGDNLGNTRITFGTRTGSTVTYQSDDYYPFGCEINNSLTGTKNEYLYNKKELQEETQEYDYGARFYDPLAVHWNTIDPLAELSRRWSPYVYVYNNPIRNVDPDGMAVTETAEGTTYTEEDAANEGWGLKIAGEKTEQGKEQDRKQARHELQSASDGYGDLINRSYSVTVSNSKKTVQQMFDLMLSDFTSFVEGQSFFKDITRDGPIELGDEISVAGGPGYGVRAATEAEKKNVPNLVDKDGNYHSGLIITGVTVINLTDSKDTHSMTLQTWKGHVEAGTITFSVRQLGNGKIELDINSSARNSNALTNYFYFHGGGKAAQTEHWNTFLSNFVKATGGQLIQKPIKR